MRKFLALSAFLLLLAAGFLPQGEAAQFFAQHYTFTAEGQLQPPLSVEFVKGMCGPSVLSLLVFMMGQRS